MHILAIVVIALVLATHSWGQEHEHGGTSEGASYCIYIRAGV